MSILCYYQSKKPSTITLIMLKWEINHIKRMLLSSNNIKFKKFRGLIVRKVILTAFSLIFILILGGCTSPTPTIKGFYQSDRVNNYHVQISIDDNSFIEYIDNREVDTGTYEKLEDRVFNLKSHKQDFEITLNDDNTFEITIKKLNDGQPILMKKLGSVPTTFSTVFDDVDEYKALLDNEVSRETNLDILNQLASQEFFIQGESINDMNKR